MQYSDIVSKYGSILQHSGYAISEQQRAAYALGFNHYINFILLDAPIFDDQVLAQCYDRGTSDAMAVSRART
jgi:hypothetical protein